MQERCFLHKIDESSFFNINNILQNVSYFIYYNFYFAHFLRKIKNEW